MKNSQYKYTYAFTCHSSLTASMNAIICLWLLYACFNITFADSNDGSDNSIFRTYNNNNNFI